MPVAGGAHGQGCRELRDNPGVKVGSQLLPGPAMGLCLQHSPGAAPDEERQQPVLTASSDQGKYCSSKIPCYTA